MRILSFKPGHDGTVALIEDGELVFSVEAEKDSFPRYSEATPSLLLEALSMAEDIPDVVCLSGWVKGFHSAERPLGAGYFGWDDVGIQLAERRLFGKPVQFFSSTHERSHLLSTYGMSPFPQGQPCYALVWEGNIGSFYEISPELEVVRIAEVMEDPGNKYQFVFALADPATSTERGGFRFSNAGKLMALAGYADGSACTAAERELIDFVLSRRSILLTTSKTDMADSPFYDIGVEEQALKNLAAHHSEEIFARFHAVATRALTQGYPLLIAGGCGLNCDWNTRWRESGLFEDVFVPPVPNDSGSAIGTAVDAQSVLTGKAKLTWSVYSGPPFVRDAPVPGEFAAAPLDAAHLAERLAGGAVIAWVEGSAEIGPRALGHRSLLAAPFEEATRDRLNAIKSREPYRPIAPVCREQDVAKYFDWVGPSPYMLYFQRVLDRRLGAVIHADGTARVQTITPADSKPLCRVLDEFERLTGVGVLCNTSLNFDGRGFINRTSDLVEYVRTRGIDGFVLDGIVYWSPTSRGQAIGQ
ncbi:carbamoyltransferase C-terminal domain-containing protein [Actinospica robiniae]|uniref:carbamoyltransferase C-terminal domain-containing protein n=1 Tax=Actinospica robiniae TaxID=304901 RepID=UPI0006854A99